MSSVEKTVQLSLGDGTGLLQKVLIRTNEFLLLASYVLRVWSLPWRKRAQQPSLPSCWYNLRVRRKRLSMELWQCPTLSTLFRRLMGLPLRQLHLLLLKPIPFCWHLLLPIWRFPEIGVPRLIIHLNMVLHYKHHPFWVPQCMEPPPMNSTPGVLPKRTTATGRHQLWTPKKMV